MNLQVVLVLDRGRRAIARLWLAGFSWEIFVQVLVTNDDGIESPGLSSTSRSGSAEWARCARGCSVMGQQWLQLIRNGREQFR